MPVLLDSKIKLKSDEQKPSSDSNLNSLWS